MASKMVLDRLRRHGALRALLRDHRQRTVQAVAERLASFAGPEVDLAACVEGLLTTVEGLVDAHRDALRHADERHKDTRTGVAELRRERDQAARELRRTLVEARDTAALLFGRGAANHLLRIHGPTPRRQEPHRLLGQVGTTLHRLENPKVGLPETRIQNPDWQNEVEAQRRSWIESLRSGHARLAQALERLENEKHRTDATRLSKSDIMGLHDQELSAIANLQEALLVLGRLTDEARSIWQGQRPRGRPARRSNPDREAVQRRRGVGKRVSSEGVASEGVSSKEVGKTRES